MGVRRLYFGNLPCTVTENQVRHLFAQNGRTVTGVKIIIGRGTGQSHCFGMVDMESPEDVDRAVGELNGSEYEGRTLTVNPAGPEYVQEDIE